MSGALLLSSTARQPSSVSACAAVPAMPSSFAGNVASKAVPSMAPVGIMSTSVPAMTSSAPTLSYVASAPAQLAASSSASSASVIQAQLMPSIAQPLRLGSRDDRSSAPALSARELSPVASGPARPASPYRPPPRTGTDASVASMPAFAASGSASPRPRVVSQAPPRAVSPARALRELPNVFSEIIAGAPLGYGGSLKPQPQLNPLPDRFDETGPESPPFRSSRGGEKSDDRRPTDPFFYPTTVNPLTGFVAIDQTIPPRSDSLDRAVPSRTHGTYDDAPLFVNAPLQSFVEKPEDMRMLQDQNDSLAKQMQLLEHAKSLAAVQSAQALQKIRARQEQLRREAQQAFQRSKEMQAEFAQPAFPDIMASLPGLTKASMDTTSSASSGLTVQKEVAGLSDQPDWNQEIWNGALSQAPSSPPDREGNMVRSGSLIVHERSGSAPCLMPSSLSVSKPSGLSSASANSRRQMSTPESPQEHVPMPPRLAAALPAFDLPPNDISAMAKHILSSHNAPFASTNPSSVVSNISQTPIATAPAEPYVDAMGYPLGPTQGKELPNIKDDIPPPLPESLGSEVRKAISEVTSVSASVPSTLPAGHAVVQQLSASAEPVMHQQLQSTPPHVLETRPLDAESISMSELDPPPVPLPQPVMERGVGITGMATVVGSAAGVAHEKAPLSARQTPAVGSTAVRSSTPGTPAPAESVPTPDTGGAGDAAAGSAATPPPLPADVAPRSSTQADTPHRSPSSSQRASRRDHSTPAEGPRGRRKGEEDRHRRDRSTSKHAAQTQRGHSPSNGSTDATAGDQSSSLNQLRNMPPNASEELQAELEECLDMIRWCSESVTQESLKDLKSTSRPHPIVKEVLEAVSLLLQGQSETRWDKLKKLVATPTFLERIQKLNFQQNTSKEMFRKLREYLQHPDFDDEQIKSVCVPIVPLAIWCRAIGVYLSKTKYRGGSDIRPVAAAGAANPVPPSHQTDRRPTSGVYMVFDPDITLMAPEELRCVECLTISRPEVGTITFNGPTDCTGLDFERIVRLEIGEVLVYPEPSLKPAIGTGLNKAATVTMYQCWPPNGSKLLQDQKSQERYKEKIKKMTEEKHATFIDYDCLTGIWKFSVEHF